MYVKTFESKKIRIEDEDWKKLLKRFDINEFKVSPNKECYLNEIECALCAKYNKGDNHCFGCPFEPFKRVATTNVYARHGCSVVTDELLCMAHSKRYRALFVPIHRVYYYASVSSAALEELKAITDFLKSFKKE